MAFKFSIKEIVAVVILWLLIFFATTYYTTYTQLFDVGFPLHFMYLEFGRYGISDYNFQILPFVFDALFCLVISSLSVYASNLIRKSKSN